MKQNEIKNGNIYYCVERSPIEIIKFKMKESIYINKPRNIFKSFDNARKHAVVLLNNQYKKDLNSIKTSPKKCL